MLTYIKTAFTKPKEIYIGRNMKNAHFIMLLLLIPLGITILSLFNYIPALMDVSEDFNEIKESIPEFELTDNQLESSTESYIYQTDSMFFYFDPQHQIDTETIDETIETTTVPLATGVLKEGLYINLIGQSYFLPYSDVSNLTAGDLKAFFENFGEITPGMTILFVVAIFLTQLLLFLYEYLPIALFANIIAIFRGVRFRLLQSFKMALLAIMPPVLIITAINSLLFPVQYSFEITLVMSLFVFYRSITEMKDRISEQSNSDE